jgi:hypothetical protein
MRKALLALLLMGLAGVFVSSASAAPFWIEQFAYNDGNLTTVSGGLWVTHSGTPPLDIQVLSQIAYGNMATFPDDNRSFPARTTTDKTYASFHVKIPAVVGTPSTNYFAHFMSSSTTFRAKTFVTPCSATFTFGISNTANAPPPAIWPTCLEYNTWYTVVIMHDAAALISKLWIDPASEASPSIQASDTVTAVALNAFGLRQSNTVYPTGTTLWTWVVDDLIVGPTFADVIPNVAVESSTWGGVKALYQ